MGEGGEEKSRGIEEVMVSHSVHPAFHVSSRESCSSNGKLDERWDTSW